MTDVLGDRCLDNQGITVVLNSNYGRCFCVQSLKLRLDALNMKIVFNVSLNIEFYGGMRLQISLRSSNIKQLSMFLFNSVQIVTYFILH